MNLKNIDNIYNKIDKITEVRISSIILLVVIGIAVGGYIDATYVQVPALFEQIDLISKTNHVLTNGTTSYLINPFNITGQEAISVVCTNISTYNNIPK